MTLTEFIDENQLTDAAFAAVVGVSQSQVSRLRRGVSRPSWETVAMIERATGGKVTAADWMSPATAEPAPIQGAAA